MTKNNKKELFQNTLALLAVMVMLMATLLTACSFDRTTDTSATEATTNIEAAKEAEPTQEPVVYEGIDMESTLPGMEWIETFNGVIDEPKMVIFNDETNKKHIRYL